MGGEEIKMKNYLFLLFVYSIFNLGFCFTLENDDSFWSHVVKRQGLDMTMCNHPVLGYRYKMSKCKDDSSPNDSSFQPNESSDNQKSRNSYASYMKQRQRQKEITMQMMNQRGSQTV